MLEKCRTILFLERIVGVAILARVPERVAEMTPAQLLLGVHFTEVKMVQTWRCIVTMPGCLAKGVNALFNIAHNSLVDVEFKKLEQTLEGYPSSKARVMEEGI